MEEEEVFDLANMNEYDLVSNEDGTVLIQDNCVVIRHKENQGMKLLPLSEEVLQALGLALVIDEDDMKKDPEEDQQPSSTEPVAKLGDSLDKPQGQKEADPVDDPTVAESESITIVFTDDEDGDGNKDRTTKHLDWTDDMVNHLLTLYEQHLPIINSPGRMSHRAVWKAIHTRMKAKYPHLRRFNEQHLQVKFKGLQRTYKGAMMYWKENLHRTNWVHFEKMHKLMGKQQPLEIETSPTTPTAPEYKSKPDDNINQYFATAQWKPAWLKITIDVMHNKLSNYNQGRSFWREVHAEVVKTSKDFDVVSPECIEKKMYYLKKNYKELQKMPHLKRRKEFADKYFGQRLMELYGKLEDSDLDEDDAELCKGPWTANLISRYLDLCYEQHYKIASSSLPTALTKIATELGVKLSANELVQMYHALRNKFNQLSKAPEETRPNYYTKLQRLFQIQDGWDNKSTMLLLDLYAKVRNIFDESGGRFWSELAERFNRVRSGGPTVTPRRCEVKINSLLTKYQALTANMDEDSKQWIYFHKMEEIFGHMQQKKWPLNALNVFLTTYQRCLNRFESDEDPEIIWRDIAKAVNSTMHPKITPTEAKAKMLEMKDKYGKLLRDPVASQHWPHYKRMSNIFSCHLWSKMNVYILLDAYDENKHRFDTEDPQTVWLDIKNQFNARSNTSAVTETQCKTEMHVLKARYNALKSNVDPSNIFWPFYERMDEVFDKQKQKDKELEKEQNRPSLSVRVEVEENDVTMDDESEAYEWTDERTTALLDAYERHRDLFNSKLKKEVWTLIDKELAEADSDYKVGVKGYGGWLQYMNLMNKFMDIKERRCTDNDWPFYERMLSMLTPDPAAASTESVASRDSIADKLHQLLETPDKSPHKSPGKSPERKRKRDDSESDANLSSVLSEDTDSQTHSTPLTRSKRNALAAGSQPWSEAESIQLLAACLQKLQHLPAPGDATVWTEIQRHIRNKLPKFSKSVPECEEKLSQLKIAYTKNKRFGNKLAMAQRMSHSLLKKVEEFIKAEQTSKLKEEPKENGTTKPDPDSKPETQTQINTELQHNILKQLQIQNEYRKNRIELTKTYQEQALAVQKEKVEALNKILEAVNKFCILQEIKVKENVQDYEIKEKDEIKDIQDQEIQELKDQVMAELDEEDKIPELREESAEDKLKALVESLQEAVND